WRITNCAAGEEGQGCRELLLSATGSMYQRQAELEPAHDESLLRRAATYYDGALGENPRNGAVLMNLVLTYRALRRDTALQRLLKEALERDPDHTGFYAQLLGDIY